MSDFSKKAYRYLWITGIDITRRQHAVFYECISLCTCSCRKRVIESVGNKAFYIPVGISLVIVIISIWIVSCKCSTTSRTEDICRLIP